ncbi:hypothetical protein [Minwuia thermotolerans]|uniref:Lipoprotein n=1 Tax=Minwuia thermotolerans TaxID=2056226 RepID=A0A2M9FXH8_9PROT|nr:hypothetical protein [Minwuia thermotolerans]PJK28172.1 hypothetical protein CVT23_17485 [Minwuia thermotolerans]
MKTTAQRLGLIAVFSGILAACGTSQNAFQKQTGVELPEETGVFAIRGDELQRLDGSPEWENETWAERSDLSPNVRFVIHDPAATGAGVRLWRVAWARSEVNGPAAVMPLEGSRWVVARLSEFETPVSVNRFPDHPGYLLVEPVQRVEPGLYQLEVGPTGEVRRARVGVNWPGVERRRYSSRNCVDRYSDLSPAYRPCRSQGEVFNEMARRGLAIELTDTQVQDGTLTLRGRIVNQARRLRTIPPLEAELVDAEGNVLQRWLFEPSSRSIEAGDDVSFTTSTANPPRGTKKANIRFLDAG